VHHHALMSPGMGSEPSPANVPAGLRSWCAAVLDTSHVIPSQTPQNVLPEVRSYNADTSLSGAPPRSTRERNAT
jgi:hypothetical protein